MIVVFYWKGPNGFYITYVPLSGLSGLYFKNLIKVSRYSYR